MSPALAILPYSARLTGFYPGSPGPKLFTRRGGALFSHFEVFCGRWEFYDTTRVTPAIIDVWSLFGENVPGADSSVNTEQQPHKNSFPPGVQRVYPNAVGWPCCTSFAGQKATEWPNNNKLWDQGTTPPTPEIGWALLAWPSGLWQDGPGLSAHHLCYQNESLLGWAG